MNRYAQYNDLSEPPDIRPKRKPSFWSSDFLFRKLSFVDRSEVNISEFLMLTTALESGIITMASTIE